MHALRVGMAYAEARALLIGGGWQPQVSRYVGYADSMSPVELHIRDELGYGEICAAGNAATSFYYKDALGRYLRVELFHYDPLYSDPAMPLTEWALVTDDPNPTYGCAGWGGA